MAIASTTATPPTLGRVAAAKSRYMTDGSGGMTGSRLVVLLYQRLVRDLVNAESAIDVGDAETVNTMLIHAQEIVEALDMALDHGLWDGAERLSSLYRYLGSQLVEANVAKDKGKVATCRALIEPLSSAWQEAWTETNPRTSIAPAAPATAPVP